MPDWPAARGWPAPAAGGGPPAAGPPAGAVPRRPGGPRAGGGPVRGSRLPRLVLLRQRGAVARGRRRLQSGLHLELRRRRRPPPARSDAAPPPECALDAAPPPRPRAPPLAPTLPIPSNAHWMPLASLVQVPFIWLLGAGPLASGLPFWLIGAAAPPITYWMGPDAGFERGPAGGGGPPPAGPRA